MPYATGYEVWALLNFQGDVHVVTTGESIAAVMTLASQHAPDLTMVSATLGHGEGLSLVRRLKALFQERPVVLYAKRMDARVAGAAMIAGADGVFDPDRGGVGLADLLGRLGAPVEAVAATHRASGRCAYKTGAARPT